MVRRSMGIGTLNEGGVHEALKAHYLTAGGTSEVSVDGYVADVRAHDDVLYEIQTSGFGAMRNKLERLVNSHQVVLVHPIAAVRYIVKLPTEIDGQASRRRSPKKGSLASVVEELVSIPAMLNHPNFELEVVLIEEEEIREYRPKEVRRRKGWKVIQRRLQSVVSSYRFRHVPDLFALVPGALPDRFTTQDLALAMDEPRGLAQKLAYCLREAGAIEVREKQGNALCYERVSDGVFTGSSLHPT